MKSEFHDFEIKYLERRKAGTITKAHTPSSLTGSSVLQIVMKVYRAIRELQKLNPNAELKMHYQNGENVIFITQISGQEDVAFVECASDNDMTSELSARFEHAVETQMDELDFFMDMIEIGITLDDIEKHLPMAYEYSKTFMEEHGLI